VAEKVLRVLAQPFELDGRSFRLGASIGIALFPSAGGDAETLLRHADAAMYRAKELGGNQYRFHS
jgi:GGDEF domain-containing protein